MIPRVQTLFPEFTDFICQVVDLYEQQQLTSWAALDQLVKAQITPARIKEMDVLLPGWAPMCGYANGRTLNHVCCVLAGLFLLPEYQQATDTRQTCLVWAALLHDIAKRVWDSGKADQVHPFRSAAAAGPIVNLIPGRQSAFSFPDV